MILSEAFDQSLKDFGISAKWLSQQSGVSEKMISGFRNSRQRIYSDSLEKLLKAMPAEVRWRFFELLLGEKLTIERLVAGMDDAKLSSLLFAVADQISPKKSCEVTVSAL